MARVWIGSANYDGCYTGPDDLIGACSGATGRRTRLQGDIERGVFRDLASKTSETLNFGMGASGLTMVSASDDPVVDNQNGANRRIRTRLPDGLSRLRKRAAHEPFVVTHLEKQIFGETEHEQIFSGNTGSALAELKGDVIRDGSPKQGAFLLGESLAPDLLRVSPQKYGHEN